MRAEASGTAGTSSTRLSGPVLVVGTFGGGGIHRYVEEQTSRLDGDPPVSTYDMRSAGGGSGLVWFVTTLFRSLWAAVLFPLRRPPAVAHVHTSDGLSFYRASFYVLFCAYVWGCPVVVHVHGSSFDEFVASAPRQVAWLQSVVLGAASRVVVLSEYWRTVLGTRVDEETVTVVPNAVDPTEYDPSYDADPPHVAFVSNHIERKGVRELVAAIEGLERRGVAYRATIAGDGPLSHHVAALADATDAVEYRGYVSEADKRRLLNESTVFVLPTHAEGLPIAMLEAMAGGNAVVSTPVGAIPEVIDADGGLLVDPGDADALEAALASLLADPDSVERLARHNRRLVEAEYAWPAALARLRQVYAAVSGTRRHSA